VAYSSKNISDELSSLDISEEEMQELYVNESDKLATAYGASSTDIAKMNVNISAAVEDIYFALADLEK
jgi:hypothetical protein